MRIAYMALEAIYALGLTALIVLSLAAILRHKMWLSVFEAVLLFGVCVSAITLFESPPRPGVVGIVVCASLLCVSVYRRWVKIEADRKTAAAAAVTAAEAADRAASAATMAAAIATETARTKAQSDAAVAATAAAAAASVAASNATEAAVDAASRAARALKAALAQRQYGDENADHW